MSIIIQQATGAKRKQTSHCCTFVTSDADKSAGAAASWRARQTTADLEVAFQCWDSLWEWHFAFVARLVDGSSSGDDYGLRIDIQWLDCNWQKKL